MEGLSEMSERLAIRPLPGFGAEVLGLDGAKPSPAAVWKTIETALDDYAVLVFREQALTRGELVDFSRRFGSVVRHHVAEYLDPENPEVMILSNNWENGKRLGAPNNGIFWHSDQIFKPRPMALTLLYGHEVPPTRGDTLFADMRAIFRALPADLQARLRALRAIHSFCASYDKNYVEAEPLTPERRKANPDIDHPVVRTHPRTGIPSLFLDPDSTTEILGIPPDESAVLLKTFFDYLDRPEFLYNHIWRPRDLVVWDNRCLMHKATGYNESSHRRIMWRTQVEGEQPV